MKMLALDMGDKWVGSAISDVLGITCRPYETVELENLQSFLEKILAEEPIGTVVIGKPITISGKDSEQTKKIIDQAKTLEKQFQQVKWILWDERLSSKRAEQHQGKNYRDKQAKKKSHSLAAAFILQSYLDNLSLNK